MNEGWGGERGHGGEGLNKVKEKQDTIKKTKKISKRDRRQEDEKRSEMKNLIEENEIK